MDGGTSRVLDPTGERLPRRMVHDVRPGVIVASRGPGQREVITRGTARGLPPVYFSTPVGASSLTVPRTAVTGRPSTGGTTDTAATVGAPVEGAGVDPSPAYSSTPSNGPGYEVSGRGSRMADEWTVRGYPVPSSVVRQPLFPPPLDEYLVEFPAVGPRDQHPGPETRLPYEVRRVRHVTRLVWTPPGWVVLFRGPSPFVCPTR